MLISPTTFRSVKRKIWLVVLSIGIWSSAFGNSKDENFLDLNTEEYPPFNMVEKGKITGISTLIVEELLFRNDIKFKKNLLPWARAISLTKESKNHCVYSMSRTPEREALFKWIGPLVSNEWVLFANAGDKRKPKKLEDVRGTEIGTYIGDAIETYLAEHKFKYQASKTDDINIKKLKAHHIDFWATGRLFGSYLLKNAQATGIEVVLTFNKTEMYLACNLQTPDSLVTKLNKSLASPQMQKFKQKVYQSYNYTF